jgi:secreted trypsin-like serine protease
VSGQAVRQQTDKIFGGNSTGLGFFPWHVTIYRSKYIIVCGGSLLSERFVLTGESPTIVERSLENGISSCTVRNTF